MEIPLSSNSAGDLSSAGMETDPSAIAGLSEAEAARLLNAEGFNELASAKGGGAWRIFLGMFRDPIFLLLAASGLLYFLLGDKQ